MIPTVVNPVTPVVAIEKVAVVAPGATITVGCTVAQAVSEERFTKIPWGPAGVCKVTVPVAVEPP